MQTEFVLDFDDIFNTFIEANQKTWGHDRGLTVGASEVFDCVRKNFFTKRGKELGFTPDEDYDEDWGAMTRGNLIENYHVAPAVQNHMPTPLVTLFSGDDQVSLVNGRASATPDGLITNLPVGCRLTVKGGSQEIVIPNIRSDCICLEIKSIDPRAVLLEERDKHHGQTQMQLGLFHEKTEWRPYFSVILYIDASFLSKITPFVVEFSEEIFATGKERATTPWLSDDPNDFMPEGKFSGGCIHCKWRIACGVVSVEAIPDYDQDPNATSESVEHMDKLVREFFTRKEEKETAEDAQNKAAETIKTFLSSRNTRKMAGPDWGVTWYGQDGRTTYDTDAMAADGIDLTKYQKNGARYDTLRVTPKTQKPVKPKTRKSKKNV